MRLGIGLLRFDDNNKKGKSVRHIWALSLAPIARLQARKYRVTRNKRIHPRGLLFPDYRCPSYMKGGSIFLSMHMPYFRPIINKNVRNVSEGILLIKSRLPVNNFRYLPKSVNILVTGQYITRLFSFVSNIQCVIHTSSNIDKRIFTNYCMTKPDFVYER